MSGCVPGSRVVVDPTHNLKIEGSNPASSARRGKDATTLSIRSFSTMTLNIKKFSIMVQHYYAECCLCLESFTLRVI